MVITNNNNNHRSWVALALTLALMGSIEVEAQTQNYSESNDYIQDIVAGIYDGDVDKFVAVFNLDSHRPNFQVEILVALYDVMDSEGHFEDPERALRLHNVMNALLAKDVAELDSSAIAALIDRIDRLSRVVREKGSEVLEAAVYLYDCNRANSTLQRLLDLLQATNQSLSEATVNRTVERVRWVAPLEELLPALGQLSRHVAQNVDALLALYDQQPERIVDEVRVQFVERLNQLRQDREYATTVAEAKQERVAGFVVGPQTLLRPGLVCLYVQQPDGTKLYIRECGQSYRACVYKYPNGPGHLEVYNVTRVRLADYNFKGKSYANRHLQAVDNYSEHPSGIRLNVYMSSSSDTSSDWSVQELDDRVMLQNGTQTLCGGSRFAIYGSDWFAYTRANGSLAVYADECRWHVQDCRMISG